MFRRTAQIATPLVAAALLLTGCGSSSGGGAHQNDSSAPPATELSHAVQALGQSHALTVSFGLGVSTADILKLGTDKSGKSGPTPAQAQAIANDRIEFEFVAPTGKTVADQLSGGASAIRLRSPTTTYASFLVVNKALYAQINLRYFFALSGALNAYRTLLHQAASLPAFAKAAVDGKWVSVPYATLQTFEGFLKGASGSSVPSPSVSKIQAIEHTALSTLLSDLTVVRTSTGTTDHLTLTSNVRTLVHDEYAAVFPKLGALSGSFAAIPSPHFNQVPSINVTLGADVTGGALSALTLDAAQFDPTIPFSLPITATFARTGVPITAPTSSTPIDFNQIAQLGAGGF